MINKLKETDMKEKLEKRLEELKKEYQTGQKTLSDLQGQMNALRETLLRISGAIQVLEEEINGKESEAAIVTEESK